MTRVWIWVLFGVATFVGCGVLLRREIAVQSRRELHVTLVRLGCTPIVNDITLRF